MVLVRETKEVTNRCEQHFRSRTDYNRKSSWGLEKGWVRIVPRFLDPINNIRTRMGIGGWEGNYISLKHTELSMSGLPRKSKTWENQKDGVPQVQKSRDTMRSFRECVWRGGSRQDSRTGGLTVGEGRVSVLQDVYKGSSEEWG